MPFRPSSAELAARADERMLDVDVLPNVAYKGLSPGCEEDHKWALCHWKNYVNKHLDTVKQRGVTPTEPSPSANPAPGIPPPSRSAAPAKSAISSIIDLAVMRGKSIIFVLQQGIDLGFTLDIVQISIHLQLSEEFCGTRPVLEIGHPIWATSLDDFNIPPNIYTSTLEYLALVADWIEGNFLEPTFGQVCDEIRECNGLSPVLSLYEIFSVLSRAARFLVAFHSYIGRSEKDLGSLINPCIYDGILAATKEQGLKYADWAKDRTSMPARMTLLVDEYHETLERFGQLDGIWSCPDFEFFDVFEPTFVAAGLSTELNLGHLIFGHDAWLSFGRQVPKNNDPRTALYRKYDLLNVAAKLKSNSFYSPLLLPKNEFRGKQASHRNVFAFHDPKDMWSITRTFPSNSRWNNDAASTSTKMPCELLGKDRTTRLMKYIITQTLEASIGPLEYSGVGHILHIGGIPHVAACKGDPEILILHETFVDSEGEKIPGPKALSFEYSISTSMEINQGQ
ncbi:hypothetical protein B0H19DRAFT_1062877 [Mycena capillaripes]|nr:hypothetical protein B0H19DRAFT_1062877 [Mycena capillaripes]